MADSFTNGKVSTRRPKGKNKKTYKGFLSRFNSQKLIVIAFVVMFAGVGSYMLFKSFAASAPPPPSDGYFSLQPVGSWKTLPSDSECATQVHRSTWEPRIENTVANQYVPTNVSLRPWPLGSTKSEYNTWMLPRVTGNFKGTTDEIIQWAACKWGWPDNVIRAEMVVESNWLQNLKDSQGRTISGSGFGDYTTMAADCPPGYTPTSQYILGGNVQSGCPRSFGVLQTTWKDGNGPFGNMPAAQDSTAFAVDFVVGTLRACYEGMETWLTQAGPGTYASGDMWGCIGRWYSGDWHSSAAETYISSVQQKLTAKPWLTWADQGGGGSSTTGQAIKFDFEDGTAQGWIKDYGTTTSVSNTTSFANTGTHGLAINTNPTTADYPGVATYNGLTGLSGGTQVTYWLYMPAGATLAGILPFAYDGSYTWTKAGSPFALTSGWNKIVWTVPVMTSVKGIGLELQNPSAWKGQIVLDSISWGTTNTTDSTSPTQPSSLTASSQTSTSINLTWSPSTDNTGVTGYDVYRSSGSNPAARITTTATNSYPDSGLTASTTYSYFVIARDAAGNSSPASAIVNATTMATTPPATDTTSPTVTITSPLNNATIGNSVTVNASATDNVKVTKLEVWFDGSLKCSTTASTTSCGINTRKIVRGTHTITVKAFDAAGNPPGQTSVSVVK